MTRVLPGFVDVQANGLMGIDFSEPGLTLDQVRTVTRELARRGPWGGFEGGRFRTAEAPR